MKILIMGLPGSGKTTLAETLQKRLNCPWFNADVVRKMFNDWEFSYDGRIRQAYRMWSMASKCINSNYILIDMVAPTEEIRKIITPDLTIWMNTIQTSKYLDTNAIFEPPEYVEIEITSFDYDIEDTMKRIIQ